MLFAQRQDIRNASNIIEEVEDVVMNFKSYAEKVEIDEHWIRKTLRISAINSVDAQSCLSVLLPALHR